MTAEEMFEELDFPKSGANRYFINYTKQEIITKNGIETENNYEIVFDKLNKDVHLYQYKNDEAVPFVCDPKLEEAIQKKIKELGW